MGYILVCDDERSICQMLQIAFQNQGHRVETVTSGEQACRKIDSTLYDVVVTDVRMPQVTGMDVLQHLRRCGGDIAPRFGDEIDYQGVDHASEGFVDHPAAGDAGEFAGDVQAVAGKGAYRVELLQDYQA